MSKQVSKAGRVPLSQKEELEASDFSHEDLDFNLLKIDPELKKELDEQGLVCRWINARTFIQSGNFHKSGWRPYKRKTEVKGTLDFGYGTSPEGYLQRNDLILAVKTEGEQKRWKAKIKQKTDIMSGVNKTRADELRASAREAGVKAKIHEGYDEND